MACGSAAETNYKLLHFATVPPAMTFVAGLEAFTLLCFNWEICLFYINNSTQKNWHGPVRKWDICRMDK